MAATLSILVVEDHDDLREATLAALRRQGHHATGVDCAEAVPEAMAWQRFDLAIVDLNLPGEDGLTLSRRLRAADPKLGIVMMTARSLPQDKRDGYESGADIYIAKPVSLEELSAAIAALGRRLQPEAAQDALRLDARGARLHGLLARDIALSPAEAALLAALAVAADHSLEHWQLIEALRRNTASDPKAALEIAVVRLRKKLQQAGAAAPGIRAVRGWGYQLCVDVKLL
ncbi:MAG: response regulator transcription factor [Pseudomonadota bacterium]